MNDRLPQDPRPTAEGWSEAALPAGPASSRSIAAAAVALLLAACSRSVVPISTATPEASTPTPVATGVHVIVTQAAITPGEREQSYAVVWIEKGEELVVRQPAGISGVGVGRLAADQGGILLTGKTTLLGSSQWVEIRMPGGGTGWVNAWNLTEQFPRSEFCSDPRVLSLLAQVMQAISDGDGESLAAVTSPRRGLIVRHNWWNPEVRFKREQVSELFTDPQAADWGIVRDSEVPIIGTFSEVILPQWLDVFNSAPEVACNALNLGTTAQAAAWPAGYTNLNFYSFYRRAPEPGNQLNWRTWGIGIEYVDGEPYVAVLVQFRGEI